MSYQPRGGDRGRARGGRGAGRGDRGGPRGGAGGGRGSPAPSSQGSYGGGARGSPQRGGDRGGGSRGGRGFAPAGRGAPSAYANVPLIYNPTPSTPTQLDARISQADSLIPALKGLHLGPERPARPGYGTAGRAIVVRANFYAVNLSKDAFFEYSIEIKPDPKSQKARVKRRILDLFEQSDAGALYRDYVAHDGAQRLISARPLPQPLSGTVRYYEHGDSGPPANADQYTVTITYTKDLPTAPLQKYLNGQPDGAKDHVDPIISALQLVLQRQAAQTGHRAGKNRFFFQDEEMRQIGPRLWALMGFYSSVRPVYKQLMVNVNVCMTAFHEPGNLAEAMQGFDRASIGAAAQEYMARVKVSTRHLGYKRVKTVFKVGNKTASQQMFPCEEFGGQISVKDFFLRKYKIRLQHADDLPVVDVGSPRKPTYLPAEVCTIEAGEPHYGKLLPDETSNMLRYASRRPAHNAHLIAERGMGKLGLSPATNLLGEFGISVAAQMTVIPARELAPPSVTYSKGKPRVNNGSWNIVDVKFHHGGKMPSWKVLVVRDGRSQLNGPGDPRLENLLRAFTAKCQSSGIQIPPSKPQIAATLELPPRNQDPGRVRALTMVEQALRSFGDPKSISMIVVLLSGRDDFIYPGIKRIASVKLGVLTQCMLLEKALKENGQDQYLSNVALKINTKLGGINHRLDPNAMTWLTQKKTMMIGIDVTHPGPNSVGGTPSIAAVVASVDKDFVQFPASLRLQKSKQEGIAELKEMVIERLLAFRQRSQGLPDRILIFRDGVSEGQYDKVIYEELPQIFQAFKVIDPKNPKYQPKLSIVICGKRHHARFYPDKSENADKNGNTRPGTVVDKGVTAIFDFDFYLQAHAGLQGTVRPTHYIVIYDENGLDADAIQQGIHNTSYLYARATKAVSLIPAAYYADVVCEQARYWIHGFLNQANSDEASSTGASATGRGPGQRDAREAAEQRVYDAAKAMWGNGLHENLKNSMFYL
ncbi:Piwi-domain-containing protein [Artomyces pyxidatus]|uniref:Piwi-domain-containing protein n=1 Tax=Artomyces pyxidatus TaxID=48021 RepID=A0ACB8TA24_9AGAM|nr:Piwi-domain-containing protein [Artomyces pyxidatus]